MNKTVDVTIYTPFGKYFAGECDYLSFASSNGVMGILPNHAPLISDVVISKLIIRLNGEESIYATSGGVLRIKEDHSVVLLLDSIEKDSDIDVERAHRAKERALERLEAKNDELDIARAKASLARALNRISVSDKNK